MSVRDSSYFNPDGSLNDEGISLYADAIVQDRVKELPEQIRKHVETSPEARKEIAALAELLDEKHLKSVPHPFFDTARTNDEYSKFPILKAAAILLVTLLMGTLFIYYGGLFHNGDDRPLTAEYTENYEPNNFYESLVSQTTRSGVITILEPATEAEKVNGLKFRWEGPNIPFTILILDNRANPVYTGEPDQNNYLLDMDLDPGLYYWRLESDEELHYVGKFTVSNERN